MEQAYMEILLEEIRGKFDLILESHDALHAKMDEYRQESNEKHDLTALKIGALKDRIDAVDQKLSERIDAVDQKLSERIDAVDQKLSERIDAVDQKLSERIDAVEQKLTTRIDDVERNLTAHIDAVTTNLAAHRADTESHPRYIVRE